MLGSDAEQGELVARLGCEAVQLTVPIRVDLKFGRSWGDAQHKREDVGTASFHTKAISIRPELKRALGLLPKTDTLIKVDTAPPITAPPPIKVDAAIETPPSIKRPINGTKPHVGTRAEIHPQRFGARAETIAKALGGHKTGSGWSAQCPAHDDQTPSLSINAGRNGKVLVHCHAGCKQRDVIAALRERGLWKRYPARKNKDRAVDDERKRSALALTIWRTCRPAEATLVETYLAARGITLPLPDALRFHSRLRHRAGGGWPAMVALVTNGVDGTPLAIHRTYLARDGADKAPIDEPKMMLGPCRSGVVRLATPGDVLMVGEGIETCLAAMQATGNPAWAALSTSGLRSLELPTSIRDVIVLADGDAAGEAAAREAAWRWKRQGRRVRIARPPRGMDFNDMLLARASREGAR